MDGWLEVKGAQVSSTSGKDDGSLAGLGMDGQWRWAVGAGSRAGATCHSAARLVSFPGLFLALDW